MEMQDKEFDQLFNSKLNDLEVEPSAEVWQNIARELNGERAKRSIVPYLSIAASIVVIASVSILFFNRTQEKPDEHPVKFVKRITPVKQQSAAITNKSLVPVSKMEDDASLKVAAVKSVIMKKPSEGSKTEAIEHTKQEAIAASPEIITQSPETVLAVAPGQKAPILQPAVQENHLSMSTELLANHPVESVEKPTNEAANTTEADKAPVRKKARGLGGIFNTIIAAVDKREDKLLEFTDAGNDEGTRITGVNLGILKIKKP